MNIVIIEDEVMLAEELEQYITTMRPHWKVTAILRSVKEAITYFATNTQYQLVFSDIQLSDGLSFSIFQQVKINSPVIFCTAYNQYAIEAFKNNGIDYILKPFHRSTIEKSIQNYESLKAVMNNGLPDYSALMQLLQPASEASGHLLVSHKDKIIPVKMQEIALFYIHNGLVCLQDFMRHNYIVNHTLDELETIAGPAFYRTDRQHLVNRKAIKDVSQYFARRLLLNLVITYSEQITIRKEKVPAFLEWLQR